MKKTKSVNSPMHMPGGRHPFQSGAGVTMKPKMAKSGAAHKTAAGVQPAMSSANAARGAKGGTR